MEPDVKGEAASLTVLLDAYSLTDASRYRGIGRYVADLLPALASRSDLRILALAAAEVQLPDNVTRVRASRRVPGRFAAREHALRLPGDVLRAGVRHNIDVLHSPALSTPRWCKPARVLTVHDLVDDAGVADGLKSPFLQRDRGIKVADHIICNSDDTAAAVSSAYQLGSDRVTVSPFGVASRFAPGPTSAVDPFLLFVGEYDPRKRHALAVRIHGEVVDAGYKVRLVFTGRVAPWFEAEWAAIVNGSRYPELIDVRGYVEDEVLVSLYRSTSALLVTSQHEGFGFPAVEAMACGAPVVAFAGGATAGVVGDGGVVIEADDVAAFVAAVKRLLESPSERVALGKAALARAEEFSWTACAAAHAAAYRSAAKRHARGSARE